MSSVIDNGSVGSLSASLGSTGAAASSGVNQTPTDTSSAAVATARNSRDSQTWLPTFKQSFQASLAQLGITLERPSSASGTAAAGSPQIISAGTVGASLHSRRHAAHMLMRDLVQALKSNSTPSGAGPGANRSSAGTTSASSADLGPRLQQLIQQLASVDSSSTAGLKKIEADFAAVVRAAGNPGADSSVQSAQAGTSQPPVLSLLQAMTQYLDSHASTAPGQSHTVGTSIVGSA